MNEPCLTTPGVRTQNTPLKVRRFFVDPSANAGQVKGTGTGFIIGPVVQHPVDGGVAASRAEAELRGLGHYQFVHIGDSGHGHTFGGWRAVQLVVMVRLGFHLVGCWCFVKIKKLLLGK